MWKDIGTMTLRSGRSEISPVRPATNSADRKSVPSMRPPSATAPYILPSARAVMTPLADGISLSRSVKCAEPPGKRQRRDLWCEEIEQRIRCGGLRHQDLRHLDR